jgi:hypothetical protein
MSEDHRAAFLMQLEHMQIRDRCAAVARAPPLPPRRRPNRAPRCVRPGQPPPPLGGMLKAARPVAPESCPGPPPHRSASAPLDPVPPAALACGYTTTWCSGASMTAWTTSAASTCPAGRKRCVFAGRKGGHGAASAQDVSGSSCRGWSSQQPRPAAKRNKAGDHASALCLQVGRRRVQFRD